MTASCAGCEATWTGTSTQHCSAHGCHQTFTGTTAGDMHRVGGPTERRCLTVEEMVEKGMRGKKGATGVVVWGTGRENPRFPASPDVSPGLTAPPGHSGLPSPQEALKSEFGEDVA